MNDIPSMTDYEHAFQIRNLTAHLNYEMSARKRAEARLENIRQLVAIEHETLDQFIYRVRGALCV